MLTVNDFQKMKANKDKITMVTAYDYPTALQAEEAGIDTILVGDSLGMVVLGYSSTIQVTTEDMMHHAKAVKRGAKNTFVIVDMPFMSYHASIEQGVINATKLFQETNAQAIKLEGASEISLDVIRQVTEGGIPVVGHLGLTPQTVNVLGGYKVQGNDENTGNKLLEQARDLEAAGISMLVLECIPKELAEIVSNELSIPTIGIGAGSSCDGQVLVYHDLLQYGTHRLPKFVKSYDDFNKAGVSGLQQYKTEVKQGSFPTEEHSYKIKDKRFLPDL